MIEAVAFAKVRRKKRMATLIDPMQPVDGQTILHHWRFQSKVAPQRTFNDFLLPKMQAISNHSRYRSILIYIPVLEIYSKHCDPNSLTSFNYLFCWGPKCDSVAYPSCLSFPWTMWKLDSMGGPWRSSNWRSWDLCWRACSQPLVPCQAGLCCAV